MERVRPIDGTTDAPHRRSPGTVAAAVVVAVAATAILISGGHNPETARPTIDERALSTVRAFETALARDSSLIEEAVGQEWIAFDLPGLELIVPWRHSRSALDDALQFYAGIGSLVLGTCTTEPARSGDRAATIVRCPTARVGGTVMEAMGLADSSMSIAFTVGDDGVVALYAPPIAAEQTVDYCLWARDQRPQLAVAAFDDECRPAVASDPATHLEIAAAFLAAGGPTHPPEHRAAKLALATVDAFGARLASGDQPVAVFDRDWFTVRFPGLVPAAQAPPFPTLSAFLDWSAEVYDVDLGECAPTTFSPPATQLVECADATWSGPLPAVLGVGEVIQPVSFLVTGYEISGVFGGSDPELVAAFAALCRDLQATSPERAAEVLTTECVPIFTPDAGRKLVALAEARVN